MRSKFIRLLALCAALTVVAGLSGCGDGQPPVNEEGEGEGEQHAPVQTYPYEQSEKIADFTAGNTGGFYASDGWSNGGMFNCTWTGANTSVTGDGLTLTLNSSGNRYYGAEYRTGQYYSYGYYGVCMKAAKGSGIVSSFFTYLGDPWDEIDIEFLGKNTTQVQFNYYTNGVGGHEFLFDLGFDASSQFHEYGFLWQPGSITWYVDGVPAHTATKDIPSHGGNIMMNLWNCIGMDDWTGSFDGGILPVSAQYKWVRYTAI